MLTKLEWLRNPAINLTALVVAFLLFPMSKFNNAYADPPPWAPAYGHRDHQYSEAGDRHDEGEYRDREREHEDEGDDEGDDGNYSNREQD